VIDLRQTPEYANYMSSIGWIVSSIGRSASGRERKTYAYIRKFPIIGSFIKIQRPEILREKEIKLIERLSKKYRVFQIVIEPKYTKHCTLIAEYGFRQSRNPFVPSKTIHIDLTKPENQLLKEMHHKTRYNIKVAQRNGINVKPSENIKGFSEFWQDCAIRQRNMFLSQKKEITALYKAFGKNAKLLLGFKGKKLVSGILMIKTKNIAYYMYAASSDKGKKLFAPTLNAWEAIKLSKKLGCKIFDFEGIYDERFPLKSWKGFTRFKKSFGGKEVEHPGAFTKFRFPL